MPPGNSGKRERGQDTAIQPSDDMDDLGVAAAAPPTNPEVVESTPLEWLNKWVPNHTPEQLLAISATPNSWSNLHFANGASFLNTRPGGAPMEDDGIYVVVEIDRGVNNPKEYVQEQVTRICGTAATLKETTLVSYGRVALVTLQGNHTLHAMLLTRVARWGTPSFKGAQPWSDHFNEGPVTVMLPPGTSHHDATMLILPAARALAARGAEAMLTTRGQGPDGGWSIAVNHPAGQPVLVELLADPATMGGDDKVLKATVGDPVARAPPHDHAFGEMRLVFLAPMGAPECNETNLPVEVLALAQKTVHELYHTQPNIQPAHDAQVEGCGTSAEWVRNRGQSRTAIRFQASSLSKIAPSKAIVIPLAGTDYRIRLQAWARKAPATGTSGAGSGSYAAAAARGGPTLSLDGLARVVAGEVGNQLRMNMGNLEQFGEKIVASVKANQDLATERIEGTVIRTGATWNEGLKKSLGALFNCIQDLGTQPALQAPPI